VSIASILNSASTLLTMDVIKRFNSSLSDAQTIRVGRWATVGLLIVAVVWAPQLYLARSLWQYLQAVLAYAVPPVVAVFLVGMFWRGANADGANATMILGSICGLCLFLCNGVLGWTHLHFLYAAPILFVIDVVILVSVSVRHPAAACAKRDATMWKLEFRRTEKARLALTPVWQDYRFLAAVLLAVTAGVVFAFR
jgi:SSS family solute:Na+ symporter